MAQMVTVFESLNPGRDLISFRAIWVGTSQGVPLPFLRKRVDWSFAFASRARSLVHHDHPD